MKHTVLILLVILSAAALRAGEHKTFPAEKVRLDGGLPIIANTPEAQKTAARLSGLLGKIYGKPFPVRKGDGKTGIAVGQSGDFPGLEFRPKFDRDSLYERQGFEIKTHAKGIWLIGGSPAGADYAADELLRSLGYRWFMPSDNWEILPQDPPAQLALHRREVPDYVTRLIVTPYDIHYAKWFSPAESASKKAWQRFQRHGGWPLNTVHCFERFIRENRTLLNEHPEYLTLWKGKREPVQLCLSNPGLRKAFIDWELEQIRKDPSLSCISVEPADNTRWCTCPGCKALGSPSTRIAGLANDVVKAVRARGGKQKAAFYAYNAHCAPPEIDVDPDVIVSICTSFLLYGWTPDRLTAAWQRRKADCGIREYYYPGLTPAGGKITQLEYAARTIPAFYRSGARYMWAEYSGHFGNCLPVIGAAYGLLWDVNTDPEAIFRDFIECAFPASKTEMAEFFRLMNRAPSPDLSEDLLARFYGLLDRARRKAAQNEAEMRRLDDLTAYIRFVEISYRQDGNVSAEKRLQRLQYLDSIRNTKMVYTYGVYRHILRRQGEKAVDKVGWKTHPAPTRAELEQFIRDGLKNNQRLAFEPVGFSKELTPVQFPGAGASGKIEPIRNRKEYWLWSDGRPFAVTITGGLIKRYRNRGNVRVELIQIGGISDAGTMETVVCSDQSVPPDGQPRKIVLTPRYAGLHKITFNDGNDRTKVDFSPGFPVAFDSSVHRGGPDSGDFFFYVPKGTKVLGYYQDTWRGDFVSPSGKKYPLGKRKGSGHFPVPPDQTGKVWQLKHVGGNVKLLTVPPQLSLRKNLLLLPEEAVAKDGLTPWKSKSQQP